MFLSMRVVAAKGQVFFLTDATCGCYPVMSWPVKPHMHQNFELLPNNGCIRSSVHSVHDSVTCFGIVKHVCQKILSRRGDGAFCPSV